MTTTQSGGYIDSRISQADRIKYAKICIQNNMDVELAARQMVHDMADHPRFQRAQNPLKLAINLVSGGGSGDNQEFNLMIFRQALDEVIAERTAQKEIQLKRSVESQEAVIQSRETQIVDLGKELSALNARLHDVIELHREERERLAGEVTQTRGRIDDINNRLFEAETARIRAEYALDTLQQLSSGDVAVAG